MKSPRVEEQKGCRILGIFMLILNDLRRKSLTQDFFKERLSLLFIPCFFPTTFAKCSMLLKDPKH